MQMYSKKNQKEILFPFVHKQRFLDLKKNVTQIKSCQDGSQVTVVSLFY